MGSIFSSDSGFSRAMNKLCDIIILSVLYILCCVPVITIGASTTAAYYVAAKVIRHNEGYVTRSFFKSFKLNFVQSLGLNISYLVCTGILIFNIFFFNGTEGEVNLYLKCAYIAMLLILASVCMYTYPVLSRFTLKNMTVFKMAFTMAFRHFLHTLGMIGMWVIMLIGIYFIPMTVIILPGLCFFAETFLMEQVLKKYMPKPDENSTEAEAWYYN